MVIDSSGRTRIRRWLGLDHNPLRRASDRIEAWVTLLLATAFVPLAVLITLTAVRVVHQAQTRDQIGRQVSAVTLAPARVPNPSFGIPEKLWVPTAWTIDHTRHTGQAQVPYGASKGARVSIWLGPNGHPISAPMTASQARIQVVTVIVMAPLILAEILTLAWAGLRWLLNRRRLASWGAEWQAFGPQRARP